MAAIFLLWVIAEIAAIWAVASLVGFLATLGLLLAGALLGSWLARREGGKAARAVMNTARAGRSPHQEVTDSMLVGLGGLLIFVPGFVSDVAGLLLLLKPTRSVVRRAWMKRLQRRGPAMRPGFGGPRASSRVIVVDSEVVDEPGGPRDERRDPPQRPVIESE
ncbi:protein affecting phage T7 exclusion by the F plasmid [Saccharomonospora azurea SZMC 14600]|uniref:FxsA family protein n=1 Tax=Saccharomonospora azurea TaxID=40988 RepID=UPI00024005E9|nr:FxsA family protein [Saccharomonospora azurea]EHK86912.1 protein affecting phage T7 exclusion by the F plasmid [Saccharomonospora azurea SZMC 14600]